jgi:multidrug efflux pump subunit AcrB
MASPIGIRVADSRVVWQAMSKSARNRAGNRLRPIAMNTLAAILTLLPLALDIGQGAGLQQLPLVLLGLTVLLWLGLGEEQNAVSSA